jgi:hypothetical protein
MSPVSFPTLQLLRPVLATVTAASFFVGGPVFAENSDFHCLVADPALTAQKLNLSLKLGRATYVGKVLELDQPWESPSYLLQFLGSVVTNPGTGQLRMYYELAVPGQEMERFVAMATSTNGTNWTKTALNVTGKPYTTSPSNNFVNLPQTWMGGPCVFVDPNAPANSRFRMSVTVDESSLYALSSADGVNWNSAGTIEVMTGSDHGLDSLNVTLWDPTTLQYSEYGRYWYPGAGSISWGRRGVYRKDSNAWDGTVGTWSGARQMILDPISLIPPGSTNYFDLYTPGVQIYHGQYVGLPAMYYHPGSWTTSGPVYPTFMYSRDGRSWSFPDPYHSMLDLSAHGQNEGNFGQAYPAAAMFERNSLWYIYYSYFPENHNSTSPSSGQIYLATIPEDRFVGLQAAPASGGAWTTCAMALPSDPGQLLVNAVVGGSLRVEVLDPATGQPFAGLRETNGVSITPGDYLGALARWDGADSLNALAGRTVAFRFVMDDVTIYSFRFSGGAPTFPDSIRRIGGEIRVENTTSASPALFLDDGLEDDAAGANPNAPTAGSWVRPSQTTRGATVINYVTPGSFSGTNCLRIQRTTGQPNTAQIEASFGTIPIGNTLHVMFAFRYESTGTSSTIFRLMSGTTQRAAIVGEPDYSVPNFYTLNGANAARVNSSLAVTPGAWQTIGIQYTSGSSDLTLTVNGASEPLVGAVTGGTVDRIRFDTASQGTTYYLDAVRPLLVSIEALPDKNQKLTFDGGPGGRYVAQAATNLTDWISISTNLVTGTESFIYPDLTATNHTKRFYRGVSQ